MTDTETFHWAFDDAQAALKHPGWKFECEAVECATGICPKCHQPMTDGRAFCPMCVAEAADPLASSIAQRQRAEKAEAAIERVRAILDPTSWARDLDIIQALEQP